MRSITVAALALCLGTPAWAEAVDAAKSAPPPARVEALVVTPSTAADPLAITRVVMADLNRDLEARLAARRVAAN